MSIAIKIENLSKQYRLGLIGTGTLSHDLRRWWYLVRGKEDPYLKIGEVNDRSIVGDSDYIWALKDINLEVQQGEVLGIIGKNGAGKSTLLKILSKVTAPTTGKITYGGRIGSLLEVGTGFHPELTGRENIYLNGAILGMRKREINRKFDEIVDFSGCVRYIDTPVKRYSSGMTVRLGFAIAAFLEPEILVVDEVLAVGDAEFQKKAIGKMQDVSRNEGRTVLFVSHNMGSIQRLCKSGILLENGILSKYGIVNTVIEYYISQQSNEKEFFREQKLNKPYYIMNVEILNKTKKKTSNFLHNEPIYINLSLIINTIIDETYLLVTILDKYKRKVFSAEKLVEKNKEFALEIKPNFLTRGNYSLQAILYKPAIAQFDFLDDICSFNITDGGSNFAHLETFDYGCVYGNFEWH
jgi:lipopolysaccharide transport system ATP-binding protein